MSFKNPTPLQPGMSGTLSGTRYRVVGRVVMGMEEAGETYYWNEFNLLDDDENSVTLVYEATERGGEWRLFTLFEPDTPMTAREAAAKQVGDSLVVHGLRYRVTLVDESSVYFIEGQAPEGVEVGDVARYFNAETGSKMVVVSWTGEEVEFYQGVTISAGLVASAFNLNAEAFSRFSQPTTRSFSAAGSGEGNFSWLPKLIALVIAGVVALSFFNSIRSPLARPVVKTFASAGPQLMMGSSGRLEGTNFRVSDHLLVEIAEVGRIFERHEYYLDNDAGGQALLVRGLKPGGTDWFMFTPLDPLVPLTPLQAAARRTGEQVNIDGYVASVRELFQATVETAAALTPESSYGSRFYGFLAQSDTALLLVRWNDRSIAFYKGREIPEKTVTAAFLTVR